MPCSTVRGHGNPPEQRRAVAVGGDRSQLPCRTARTMAAPHRHRQALAQPCVVDGVAGLPISL
jgi:hypothetical protein